MSRIDQSKTVYNYIDIWKKLPEKIKTEMIKMFASIYSIVLEVKVATILEESWIVAFGVLVIFYFLIWMPLPRGFTS